MPSDPLSEPSVDLTWFADRTVHSICHSASLAKDVAIQAHDRIAQECAITQSADDDNSVAAVQEAILDALWSVARGWSDVHDDVAEVRELAKQTLSETGGTKGSLS